MAQRVLETQTQVWMQNSTTSRPVDILDVNTDIYSKVFVTMIYAVLFAVGLIGNSITLYISLQRRTIKPVQGTLHYHLASFAVSDLLILVLCMPVELYNFSWIHHPWAFGEVACRSYYFLRDGCSYATAFNIVGLSVERYVALCHPFKAKSRTSRGRTSRLICALWGASLLLASPMLLTMGQLHVGKESISGFHQHCKSCSAEVACRSYYFLRDGCSYATAFNIVGLSVERYVALCHPFKAKSRTSRGRTSRLICALWGASLLLASPMLLTMGQLHVGKESISGFHQHCKSCSAGGVVFAFVLCWLPYHCRRLMYCYITEWTNALYDFYHYFYMVTNVLFYMSSVVNPILYNLVSSNFRQVFRCVRHRLDATDRRE